MTRPSATSTTAGDVRAPGDVPIEEFDRAARAALEWIERFLAEPERLPVLAQVAPGDIGRAVPPAPPAAGEPLDRILRDFETTIVPGMTHWNHPGFLAYFAISGSEPGIIGEMLTAALNVNAMLWRSSPAATELELVVTEWLRQMVGLDEGWTGFLNDTASTSTFLALAAAREARSELAIRERGLAGRSDVPPLRVYCSAQAHSSVDKAVIALGLGHENLVHIETDERFRMRTDRLAAAMRTDVGNGLLPLAVVATAGTTSTTSVDPLAEAAEIAHAHHAWLHVDAAYGGAAALLPELRPMFRGWEKADSIVMNPHKWLFTQVGASALFVRRPEILRRAFALVPDYLVVPEADAPNLMDYGLQLGRPFRALKLWMVIRAFGADGLAARIRHHVELAHRLAERVESTPDWTLAAPVPFSTVCLRYAPRDVDDATLDRWNEAIMARVNASGEALLSHTRLNGRYVIRVAIGNIRTEWRHVQRTWELLCEAATKARTA